jgi:AcrR family transcriptional regulator
MPKRTEQEPQTRILDAAEEAIAEQGFAGASLRDIVKTARVNLATVYYYFRSKRGLLEAVLKRRLGPLRDEHLALLRDAAVVAKGKPLPVEEILEAMLRPPLRLMESAPAKHQAVTRLLGRIVTEPNPLIQEVLRTQRSKVRDAFVEAFQRSLPRAPLPCLLWRIEFVWGALAFTMCNPRKMEVETHGACNPAHTEKVLAEMIHFFSAGFHALAQGRRQKR